jgi:hypothetical protein
MPSHTPVLASLLLACLLTACGGAESMSASTHDTNARTPVAKPLPDGDADASAAGLDGSRRPAAQVGYKPFVLDGYEVLGAEPGDLNKDAYPDVVLALKIAGEEAVPDPDGHPAKRPLLLLLGQADGSLKLAARNDNVVLCRSCGGVMGDPFEGITVKNGFFSIEHAGGAGWRWTRIITFKWYERDKDWLLHRDGGVSYHVSDLDKMKEDLKTVKDFGVVPFGTFRYEP